MRLLLDSPVRARLDALAGRRTVRRVARWASLLLLLAPVLGFGVVVRPATSARRPAALAPDSGDLRFGVPLAERRKIWGELARHDPEWRQKAARRFPDAWSQQDDYSADLAHEVLDLAARRRLHYSIVYLIFDEGLREHWPGPDGKPLLAVPVPLRPRLR